MKMYATQCTDALYLLRSLDCVDSHCPASEARITLRDELSRSVAKYFKQEGLELPMYGDGLTINLVKADAMLDYHVIHSAVA